MSQPLRQVAESLNSAFYIGQVMHKRLEPKVHQFIYPLYMLLIDLDEVDQLHRKYWWFSARRWAPLQFKPSDYFKSAPAVSSLSNSAQELKQSALSIATELGAETDNISHVFMLAQLRCFGFYFSPVNFFFLNEGSNSKYLLAEVSNTPWNKKHCYLIDLEHPEHTPKAFHVSPFMNLDMHYRWTVKPPNKNAYIRIENWNDERLFTAHFSATRHEITANNTRKVLLKWPAVTGTIVRSIYWQAAKLFLKGISYVPYQTATNPTITPSTKGETSDISKD